MKMERFALVIDLDTEAVFQKEVEAMNATHSTNFKVIAFTEDVEVSTADIDVPENEVEHLFTLGLKMGYKTTLSLT